MSINDYSDEFKADAVALYESTPGATFAGIAADLGVDRTTLRDWVRAARVRREDEPGRPGRKSAGRREAAKVKPPVPKDPGLRIRQLEARVAELEASEKKLATERDILRKAAKYFAGETNW